MFVGVQTLHRELRCELELLEVLQHGRLNRNFILADYQALVVANRRVCFREPLVRLDLGCRQPVVGVRFHDPAQHVLAVGREVTRHLELATQDFLVELARVLVLKGEKASEHREEDDAAGPDVDLRAEVPLTFNHFGRRVARTAARCLELHALFVRVGETEVDQLQVLLVVEQQILRFQVAMHDAQLVQVLNRALDLLEVLAGFLLRELLLLDDVVEEFAPRHVLHDEEKLVGRFDDLEELDDVGVADHLQDLDLSRDALHVGLLHDFFLLQDFNSNLNILQC